MSEEKFFANITLPGDTLYLYGPKRILPEPYPEKDDFDPDLYRSAVFESTDMPLKGVVIVTEDELQVTTYIRFEGIERGYFVNSLTFSRRGSLPEKNEDNVVQLFYVYALRAALNYIRDNCSDDEIARISDPKGGLLFERGEEEGAELTAVIVNGRSRPDLPGRNEDGSDFLCRPYADEQRVNLWDLLGGLEEEPEDDLESLTAFAEEGDEEALDRLYQAYLNGDEDLGVDPDPAQAVHWLLCYAETGSSVALFNLGLHYAKGFGVARDYAKALDAMRSAAEAGDEDAPAYAEKLEKILPVIAAAEAGDPQAAANYAAFLMEMGNALEQAGPGKDYEDALRWAQKAADAGVAGGWWVLALAHEHGRGVPRNMQQAAECYRKGAELGHAECQNGLGCCYLNGAGVPKDMEKGFALVRQSAENGYGIAMYNLGRCYQFGHGVADDMEKAVEWFEKSLEVRPDAELAQKVAVFRSLLGVQHEAEERAAREPMSDDLAAKLRAFQEKQQAARDASAPDTDPAHYTVANGVLVKYTGPGGQAVVPAGITAVGDRAFVLNDAVTEVVLPEGVTKIGNRAFMGCHHLRAVTLPASVREIAMYAFCNCDKLAELTLPASLQVIGECAFINCTSLTRVEIPAGVTVIGNGAFTACTALTAVSLPEGLTTVEYEAFADCTALQEMNVPASLQHVGVDAFRGCSLPNAPAETETQKTSSVPGDSLIGMLQQLAGLHDTPLSPREQARRNLIDHVQFLSQTSAGSGTTAEYDRERGVVTILGDVTAIRGDGVPAAEALQPGQAVNTVFEDGDTRILTTGGVYLGHVSAYVTEQLGLLLQEGGAEILKTEVAALTTRAQRGPRARVPLLSVRITAQLAPEKDAGAPEAADDLTQSPEELMQSLSELLSPLHALADEVSEGEALPELTFAEGQHCGGDGYTIGIPDGFRFLRDYEGRDFTAWLPTPGSEDKPFAGSIVLHAGPATPIRFEDVQIDLPETMAAVTARALWETKAQMDFLGETEVFPVETGACGGAMRVDSENNQVYINLGFTGCVKQFRLYVSPVWFEVPDAEALANLARSWAATLQLKKPFPGLPALDTDFTTRFLNQHLADSFRQAAEQWGTQVDLFRQFSGQRDAAQLNYYSGRDEMQEEDACQLLTRQQESVLALKEKGAAQALRTLQHFSRTNPDSPLLLALYEAAKPLFTPAEIRDKMNKRLIVSKSEALVRMGKEARTPAVDALLHKQSADHAAQERERTARELQGECNLLFSRYETEKQRCLSDLRNSLDMLSVTCNYASVSEMSSVRSRFTRANNDGGNALANAVRRLSNDGESLVKRGAGTEFIRRMLRTLREAQADLDLSVSIDTGGYGDWHIQYHIPADVSSLPAKWQNLLNQQPEVIAENRERERQNKLKALRTSVSDLEKQLASLQKQEGKRADAARKAEELLNAHKNTLGRRLADSDADFDRSIALAKKELSDAAAAADEHVRQKKEAEEALSRAFFLAFAKKRSLSDQIVSLGSTITADRSRLDELTRKISTLEQDKERARTELNARTAALRSEADKARKHLETLPAEIAGTQRKLDQQRKALQDALQE